MNLYAIKVTAPCGEFEYHDVFVVFAGYTDEAVKSLRASGKIGCEHPIDHVALIAQNVTIPGIVHPTTLY